METIRVDYSRKVSPGNYESVGVGGSLEFKPASDDIQDEFDKNFLVLKLIVDAQLAQQASMSGGSFDNPDPDLGEEPEWARKLRLESEAKMQATNNLIEADGLPPMAPAPAPPPPLPAPAPAQTVPVQVEPAVQAASVATQTDGAVYLGHAKVFRSNMKRSKTGRVYAELRVGHDDLPAHINDQYVTVRVFDPAYAAVVGSLQRMKNEETGEVEDVEKLNILKDQNPAHFVDLWGQFSPWKTDPAKSDFNANAIQKSQ